MRILILLFVLFCEISFAKTFTLSGTSEQSAAVSFINGRLKGGYSVFCDFTALVGSADLKIFLGNNPSVLTQASLLNVLTTGIHGLEAQTFAHQGQVVIKPLGGSFTAVCTDNQ